MVRLNITADLYIKLDIKSNKQEQIFIIMMDSGTNISH